MAKPASSSLRMSTPRTSAPICGPSRWTSIPMTASRRHHSPDAAVLTARGGGAILWARVRPLARRPVMTPGSRRLVLALTLALALVTPATAAAPVPAGRAVMAWHVTIAPSWFDPSTAPPQITPFGLLYAIHDALVRPYPGHKMGPSLAESWKESPDGKTYEFKLRAGLKFHNGDPVTTEDVKFSFERYKGAGAKVLQSHVQQVEIVSPLVVRFQLKEAWPDFMTFYGTTASAAGIVVPKKYMTQAGDDGFKKHPIGAGPYKFVSHKPGVEVVLEANPGYWRRVPIVKTLVMKSVPDANTRAVMLKSGEADIAVALDGPDAENLQKDPRMQVVASKHASIFWIEFTEQWDPKSPWHDKRLRQAVNLALNRKAINDAGCVGMCPPAGVIMVASGNSGNAASRVETFIQSKGSFSYGGYPDIDDLFLQQGRERDVKKREAILFKIQQLTIDRVMYAPVIDLRALMGVGPRVSRHTITDVWMSPFPSYED